MRRALGTKAARDNSEDSRPTRDAQLRMAEMVVLPPVQGRRRRGPPYFTSPITHWKVPTGIKTDTQSLQAAWKTEGQMPTLQRGAPNLSARDVYQWRYRILSTGGGPSRAGRLGRPLKARVGSRIANCYARSQSPSKNQSRCQSGRINEFRP
jgi:hypothetical protein